MNQFILLVLNQSVQESIEGPYRGFDAKVLDAQEGAEGIFWPAGYAVVPNHCDEEVFSAFDAGLVQLGQKGLHGVKSASSSELVDDGMVSVVVVAEVGVVVAGVVEDLEGEIEVLLAGDHGNKAFGVEFLGPWIDWGRHSVGFEELVLGFDGGEVAVGGVGEERVDDGGGERASCFRSRLKVAQLRSQGSYHFKP